MIVEKTKLGFDLLIIKPEKSAKSKWQKTFKKSSQFSVNPVKNLVSKEYNF